MYHLVKSVYANLTKQEEYSVLIMGLDNAGKTTLLEQLKFRYKVGGEQATVDLSGARLVPTVGQNVARIQVNKVNLKIWDVGGQESLRNMWESYYEDAHVVVFVVDSTDRARIEECRDTLDKVVSSDVLEGTPVLMLANKQDRDDCLEVEDIKEIFNKIAEKMSARDSRVLPVCALDGTGVVEAAEWIISRLLRNKNYRPPNLV
ncbi:ADP-ribosylation factor-like protein 3 [Wickerhamiella sorbophila]|uniref:ADP-ribosylation factor-like protein 3 n=1 Tax=Wickerhamiella sorbophila TaxID=45607 RepID=A0A2T0FN85_9ASCO|nr:ADP-ribosylation factor-like protein 3 [Wickerhamiella sorbophila]PRT56444.1 ADP-ribosylation factor-like protein 3 [Wickerhamiella sorbophila]